MTVILDNNIKTVSIINGSVLRKLKEMYTLTISNQKQVVYQPKCQQEHMKIVRIEII